MAIYKTNNGSYTIINNDILQKSKLSNKAKGLLCTMLSLPQDWQFSIKGLIAMCEESETSIKSTLKELKEKGFVVIRKKYSNQTKSGKFEYQYDIYDTPQLENKNIGIENLDLDSPYLENPEVENPPMENVLLQNNNIQSNNIIIDEIDIIDENKKKIIKRKNEELLQPNKLTELLIKMGVIEDGLEKLLYNRLFNNLLTMYDYDLLYSVVSYVGQQVKQREYKDEKGNRIENLYGYIKTSVEDGISYLQKIE